MDIWTLGASVLVGLATGAGVSYASFRLQRSFERERWQREDRTRREDLARAQRERWLGDQRQLFAVFLRQTNDLRGASRELYDSRKLDPAWRRYWDDAYQGQLEIGLVAPELELLAEAAYDEATDLLQNAKGRHEDEPLGATQPDLESREQALDDAYSAFYRAAQGHLGSGDMANT